MEKPLMTKPWSQISEFYCELVKAPTMTDVSIVGMADLVKQIEASRYAADLHAWTSMFTLLVVQTPVSYPYDGQRLTISPIGNGKIEFRFIDSFKEEGQWHRVVDQGEAFRCFERFLDKLHWFRFDGSEGERK
jgi:hypothetical protein